MKLSYKLFSSYVFVVLVALLVLATATAWLAPVNFAQQMTHMQGNGAGMMEQRMIELDAELKAGFQDALNNALILAGIAAILTAMGVSWFVSQRIINPIRSLVVLSQRIASGHYEQRLHLDTRDELGELVDSFNRMTQSLATTEAMRVQLLGDVTHELKTPLASIKGYMEALQDEVLPVTPETFQIIHQEADRLERLVRDLQQLSQTEAGQVSLNIQSHKSDEIVQAVIDRMRPQFNEKGILLHVDVPQILPEVRADRDRAAQVLTNLIGNALQYTDAGGEVRITALSDNGYIRFNVTDTGCGLAANDLNLVFQRFYRVDKSRSRASGGSGIGLTLAKHLIEAQGGDISATSIGVGKGSRFTFTLPTV